MAFSACNDYAPLPGKARLGLGMTDATAKHAIIVVASGVKTTGILVEAVFWQKQSSSRG